MMIREATMARKPMKKKAMSSPDDILDLGAMRHSDTSLHNYGRLDAIWRDVKFPTLWSAGAISALALVVYIGTTERGGERLAALPAAVATMVGQATGPSPNQLAVLVDREVGNVRDETRRLQVERGRWEQRLSQIERELNDVTGSVRRGTRDDVTGSVAGSDRPTSVPTEAIRGVPTDRANTQERQAPLAPSIVATAPAREQETANRPTQPEIVGTGSITLATRSQFGIDLGSDATLSALRLRWQRLNERYKPALAKLEPLVSIRDGNNGYPVLFLVAGPISDVADAAALCAQLKQASIACQPVAYDGQRLITR